MSLFLSDIEKTTFQEQSSRSITKQLYTVMKARVQRRALRIGLTEPEATTEWWHHVAEVITDAAFIRNIAPTATLDAWLRAVVLDIIRRPAKEWGGPSFRGYGDVDPVGTLETGHLSWSLAMVLDLVPDIFKEHEKDEIEKVLRTHGLDACRRFLEKTDFCHNWNCVLLAGFAATACVLDDSEAIDAAIAWFPLAADHFQTDGSYGESLQYANYAAYSIVIARESLLRKRPSLELSLDPYVKMVEWAAQSLFYHKPLSSWGPSLRPRSANFGDSGAIFRPSGDVLLHIAKHAQLNHPKQAHLARWMFDTLYQPNNEKGPDDLASFGFVPGFGFLSLLSLPFACQGKSPAESQLATMRKFSGGDVFMRDAWDGQTILATRVPAEPRRATAHLHGDIHSCILVHNHERLLIDPGHSCYRNLNHQLESSSSTHNTCTFQAPEATHQEPIQQKKGINRPIIRNINQISGAAPICSGGKQLLCEQQGPVSIIASDAAEIYGEPITKFVRFWILCGKHVVFCVDHIDTSSPISTTWNWLLNNRDAQLKYDYEGDHQVVAHRHGTAIKISHLSDSQKHVPIYAHAHDAYHPLPNQLGEGAAGSAHLLRWSEKKAQTSRVVAHGICLDTTSAISHWSVEHLEGKITITDPDHQEQWTLQIQNQASSFEIFETKSKVRLKASEESTSKWSLN